MFQLIENVNWGKRKVSPEAKQWLIDKYDASILYNDRAIGDLLKGMVRLGLAEDTLVCILSDHGEEFLEHGHLSHGGIHLNEEIIRTVGIIHDPSAPTGQTLSHPLGQVDIFPTLLALAGARDIPETMVRRSIAGRVNPAAGPTADPAPVFCHGKSKVAARMGSHKYIHTRPSAALGTMARLRLWLKMALLRELGEEIYDLQNDPAELENLISRKDLKSMLRGALDTHLQDQSGILIAGSADDEERRRIEQEMKDLGYM